jgi:hypothetical protein
MLNIRRDLERKIERKRQEVDDLLRKAQDEQVYLRALEDTLKMLPKDSEVGVKVVLRAGSDLEKVQNIIRKAGHSLHIAKIVEQMGKPYSANELAGLIGSLSSYSRRQRVFTKTAPNTFGLLEFLKVDLSDNAAPAAYAA